MNAAKTGLVAALSAILSFVSAFVAYISFEDFSGVVRLLVIILCGLAIGICQGLFIQRSRHRAVGIGTFIGILILWLPVVVVTYGFALLAIPLLAAFAMVVFFGAKLGANLRVNACRLA